MEEFDFTVVHRPGSKHQNADALSRCPARSDADEGDQPGISSSGAHDAATARAICRTGDLDPDFRPCQRSSPSQPVIDDGVSSTRVWHVHAPDELAKLQCADQDIGPIVRLRLEYDEQPSMDVLRDQSTNTKIYWTQWRAWS